MVCDTNELDQIFEAMANDHRRGIIYTLSLQPRSISQLAEQEGLTLPAISKHVKTLEIAKLVVRKKSGRTNFLMLNKRRLAILQNWTAQYHTHWGNQEESKDNYVAGFERAEKTLKEMLNK